jgi:RimJ/RimL family protein N-acetyltransferase
MRAVNAAIRILTPSDSAAIARHLLQLSAEERRLRFGTPLSDAAIEGYAVALNFSTDQAFGAFEDDALVGLAHFAPQPHGATATLGVSVSPGSRCRGYAHALLCVAAQHARRVACRRLDMPCLAENRIMVHLARKAGMSVIGGLGQASAYIALGGPSPERSSLSVMQRFLAGRKVKVSQKPVR